MARDLFHYNVREALEKESWNITNDPLRIPIDGSHLEIDLAAEMVFGAERGGVEIAVEVKSFLSKSFMNNFHEAMGQYLDYRSAWRILNQTVLFIWLFPFRPVAIICFKGVSSKSDCEKKP